ncbi:MAG: ABC transporter substrate-binding protein [Aeromicrobium sp.]
MKRSIWAVAGLVAAAMLIAGCSSSSNDGGATPKVNSKLTGDPIVVGTICSCSGQQSAGTAIVKKTINAWASWTNAHDGVNGHPVKLIFKDDGGDPAAGLAAAKSLVEQDHVIAIVGMASLVDSNWASYVKDKGVPVIGGLPYESSFLSNPDFFVSGTPTPVTFVGQFLAMQKVGIKHFGLMYCAESPVCARLGQLAGLASKLTGGTISSKSIVVSATSASYNSQCLAMKDSGVDALFIGSNSTVVTRVVDACAKLGYTPKSINSSPTFSRDWLKDPNLEDALLVSPNANYLDPSIPGVKEFTDALSTYAPDVQTSDQFAASSIFSWAGGQLFAAAAKAADLNSTSTPAELKKGLYALKDETLNGIAPPLNFTEGQPGFPTCYFNLAVTAGKLVTTDGGTPTCLEPAQVKGLAAALQASDG